MKIKTKHKITSAGFTLVEMLIALTVGAIVLTGLAVTFTKQSDTKLIQEDVTELLQNGRVVRALIADDIRMAGYYGPNGPAPNDLALYPFPNRNAANPTPGGLQPNSLTVRYFEDNPMGGAIAGIKTVGYDLYDSVIDLDTIADNMGWTNSNLLPKRPLINDVDGLEFLYTLNDGTSAVNSLTTTPTQAQIPFIKAVTVTMLLRGKFNRSGSGVTDLNTYRTPFGRVWGPFDDGFKRRLITFTVSCRNMEL
ncbi:MAG TPA: prepilin-type N-terminal cleavage/methylation domain-containing protein [Desulfobacterales bacterium]|nr:prepilin-type N-terminal cleavage/methylation domain-containing protein [Desulfobacterales bacterium]HIP39624.1 prepilin-type N-terminal cleavage/methylation domain-containing protein [Desulfocapsa sulfexigens]